MSIRAGALAPESSVMRVAAAQIENRIGDFPGNIAAIVDAVRWAEDAGAAVLVLPELALTGYPLDDLALHTGFVAEAEAALVEVAATTGLLTVVCSTIRRVPPRRHDDTQHRDRTISAAILHDGEVRGWYDKHLLPTYSIFAEQRVFAAGDHPARVWRLGDVVVGVAICEDAWSGDGPPEAQSAAGAQALLLPNASPFEQGKDERRLALVRQVARRNGVPVVYVNSVGGNDELVFDGGSIAVDAEGGLLHRAPQFTVDRFLVDLPLPSARVPAPLPASSPVTVHTRPLPERRGPVYGTVAPALEPLEQTWRALVLGTRDFAWRNGFEAAVVGVSGGVDSSMTAAVAVDALGADRVLAVTGPSGLADPADVEDVRAVAERLGVRLVELDLRTVADGLAAALGRGLNPNGDPFAQRLVLRLRAAALRAIADAEHRILLGSGNKSELSLGTAVTGGDFVGQFAPLADCSKTLLRALARHRNGHGEVIPPSVIDKPATAERSATVPNLDWRAVDDIVERYVERMQDLDSIDGHDPRLVSWVAERVVDSEFDRRQAPPGVRVTGRAFGQDRRVPLTQMWRPHRAAPETAEVLATQGADPAPGEEGPSGALTVDGPGLFTPHAQASGRR